MADDENVTELPTNNNQGGKKKKTPQDILTEIENQFMSKAQGEFKNKATAALEEVKKCEKNLALAKANLNKLVEEYQAEYGV
jgi:uncharacterized FlaG/YvyC family protein